MRALCAVTLLAVQYLAGAEARFTDQLWTGIAPIYAKTLDHPYLKGLAAGTLPRESFEFYLQQDALFLSKYSEALKILAAKAPREEWRKALMKDATEAIDNERQLHDSILKGRAAHELAPSNYAYTNHLIAAVSQRPFAEGLAAMLPCYWIYEQVGTELKKRGSKDRDYQRWIDQYSDPGYGATVGRVLDMMNAEAKTMDPAARARAAQLFTTSARYEYMFWDMAWRTERWVP